MNDENGNRSKAFELAPVKTPEQIEHDTKKKIAPQIRDAVFKMQLPAQVKFFFAALLDITFLYKYGGDGRGRIWTNVRKLSQLWRHDPESITKWRDALVAKGLIWVSDAWPKQQWRICALYAAPEEYEYQPDPEDYIQGKAGALEKEENGSLPDGVFLPKSEETRSISGEIRRSDRKTPGKRSASSGTVIGSLPDCDRIPSDKNSRHLPNTPPKGPAHTTDILGKGDRIPSDRSTGRSRNTRETPIGVSVDLEAKLEGKGTSPQKIELLKAFKDKAWGSWALGLALKYQRELKELRADLLVQRKQLEPGDPQISDLSERLDAVDIALYGGRRPQPAKKPARPVTAAPTPKPPSEAELLAGARYALSIGKPNLMNEAQKKALARAGGK